MNNAKNETVHLKKTGEVYNMEHTFRHARIKIQNQPYGCSLSLGTLAALNESKATLLRTCNVVMIVKVLKTIINKYKPNF